MRRIILLCMLGVIGISCRDLTSAELPAGTKNPKEYETRTGALSLYHGAVYTFQTALIVYLEKACLITDECAAVRTIIDSVDIRRIPSGLNNINGGYQQFAPDVSPALRGHLFALQGYAEILLADLFCSGIPLSTLDFDGDFTYRPGSSTEEVYEHAIALFDSALALSSDSVRIEYLARIGKARALLQLANYDEAAAVVESVPATYQYAVHGNITFLSVTIADLEGGTGLPYRSDPRVDAVFTGNATITGRPMYHPRKYLPAGSTRPLVVASGVEAQLIQAEADLHAGRTTQWLERLNALRTDSTFEVTGTDTVWGIGLGASLFAETPDVAAAQHGLRPLADPADGAIPPGATVFDVRVNLLFAERAYWLFQTGQRQGDLRRLVREYGRPQTTVYPSQGLSVQGLNYGDDVTLPITMQMEGANPHFQGCIHRDA
jgi:tetratricopeptide (TPR) repeat protein